MSEKKPYELVSFNLLQRIHAIMRDVSYVQKDKEVGSGNWSYMAVTHDAVTAKVRKAMVNHGVVCWIADMTCEEKEMVFEGKNGTRKETRCKVRLDVIYASVDDSNDMIHTISFGHGLDGGDKSVGKAVSYAFKYNLLKTFMLETGEDSDLEASKKQAVETVEKEENARAIKKSELWALMQANHLADDVGIERVESWSKTEMSNLSIEGMQEVIDAIKSGGGLTE